MGAATASLDEDAFRALVEPHRRELHAHCYRMLGSVHDAEDALQDALIRAWKSMPRLKTKDALRPWLYRIATNTSIDLAQKRRVLPMDFGPYSDPHDGPGEPLVESVWVEPYPDAALGYEQRESIELAFIAALQHLPPRQRAVLVMREVLNFSAQEVADALDTTVASVNSALQRARAAVEERTPEHSQQETLQTIGDDKLSATVEAYVDAWERGDVDGVVGLLVEDATIAMPPMPTWYQGRDNCRVFFEQFAFAKTWTGSRFEEGDRTVKLVPTRANGQQAFAAFRRPAPGAPFEPYALQVLTFADDGRIADITGFVMPGEVERFAASPPA